MPIAKKKIKIEGKNYEYKCSWHHGGCGGVYGLGFVGAAIYYISTASGFWMGVLGILKAAVWPAFLVYEILHYLGA